MEEFLGDQQLIFGTPAPLPKPNPKCAILNLEGEEHDQTNSIPIFYHKSLEMVTKESSRTDKKRLAGQKSREKKKNYVKTLEERVKQLTLQIEKHDKEIYECKDKLVEALKTSHSHTNEHTYTFTELEKNTLAEDPDLDKINLLIDIIRNRIGANGKERQGNINYAFKQTINSIFPAIYRYILNTAKEEIDIFSPERSGAALLSDPSSWMYQIYANIRLDDEQVNKFYVMKEQLCKKRMETVSHIKRLIAVKEAIKSQGQSFEHEIGNVRNQLNPIQSAIFTIFAEKNKLRRQFTFSGDFQDYDKMRKNIKRE